MKSLGAICVIFVTTFASGAASAESTSTCFVDVVRTMFRPKEVKMVIYEKWQGVFKDGDMSYPFSLTTIQSGPKIFPIHDLKPLNTGSSAFKIELVPTHGPRIELRLPYEIKQNILKYIEAGASPSCKKFDCNSFGHYVNGVEHVFGEIDFNSWKRIVIRDTSLLSPGDTIILAKSEEELEHVAIYLGHGIFLSKLGGNPLTVMDLKTLQEIYPSSEIWQFVPVKK